MANLKYRDMRHRLHENSVLDGNGCHVWVGAKNNDGYGKLNIRVAGDDGKKTKHVQVFAHRVAFEENVRKLKSWEEVDHVCLNRACINIDHLQAITHKHNSQLIYTRRKKNG